MVNLRNISIFLVVGLITLFISSSVADNDFIVGVCTHLMSPPTSMATVEPPLDLAIQAGIGSVRDTPYWSSVETVKGQLVEIYEFNDFMTALLPRTSLKKLFILGNINQFYNNGNKPQGANVTGGFANYVNFITNLYKNKVQFWEIWNEWDLDDPANPATATQYMFLANTTIPIVRANDPNAKILGGCVTSDGLDNFFADRIIQQGIMDKVDGLSIHPYNFCGGQDNTPEVWYDWINRTDARLFVANRNRTINYYITEMTWPTSHPSTCGSTLDTQAAYLARVYFLARSKTNIKGMWWYDIYNDGLDFYDREHNFGLLDHNWVAKPAWYTMKVVTPFIANYTYDPTRSSISNPVYRLGFYRGNQKVLVSWLATKITTTQTITISTTSVVPLGVVRVWYTTPCSLGEWTDSPWRWNCVGTSCTSTVIIGKFPIIFDVTPILTI